MGHYCRGTTLATKEPFARGFDHYVKYNGVYIPEREIPEMEYLARRTLRRDKFGVYGSISFRRKDGKFIGGNLLSTSHDFFIYDPAKRTLERVLNTCDEQKSGIRTFNAFDQEILQRYKGVQVARTQHKVFTKKELIAQTELFPSVKEALAQVPLSPTAENHVLCVFYDLPPEKIDEDKLETIMTGALKPDERKPTTELVHRFEGQGYTIMHISESLIAGKHSFIEYGSLVVGLIGKEEDIKESLLSLERRLGSKTRAVSFKKTV
jgi:S-adenosylmethionine/arginine decarboxylase-like enzyme